MDTSDRVEDFCKAKLVLRKKIEHCQRRSKSLIATINTLDKDLIEMKHENCQAKQTLKAARLKLKQLCEEVEKWQDGRVGTEDEFNMEAAASKQLNQEYEAKVKETKMNILKDVKGMKEMQALYKPQKCDELTPSLVVTISKQHEEKEALLNELEMAKEKIEKLSVARDRKRETEAHYPSEDEKAFVLKEFKKLRHDTAVELARVRLQSRETTVDNSSREPDLANGEESP